jgi:curli biogenesis system outer membrane secretion channel CsgG
VLLVALPTAAVAQGAGTAQTSSKPHIAVLTFEGDESTKPAQRAMLSDRMQAELIASGKFVVLDRAKIDEILREQGFQASGACTSSECQVEVGKLLGVEKLVSGKVVSFDPVWTLSASLTDVGSGAIEQSVNTSVEGRLFDVLDKGCPALARQIAGKFSGGGAAADAAADAKAAASEKKRLEREAKVRAEQDAKAAQAEQQAQQRAKKLEEERQRQAAQAAEDAKPKVSMSHIEKKQLLAGSLITAGVVGVVVGWLQNAAIQEKQDAYTAMRYGVDTDQAILQAESEAQDAADSKGLWRTAGLGLGTALLASGVGVVLWF